MAIVIGLMTPLAIFFTVVESVHCTII